MNASSSGPRRRTRSVRLLTIARRVFFPAMEVSNSMPSDTGGPVRLVCPVAASEMGGRELAATVDSAGGSGSPFQPLLEARAGARFFATSDLPFALSDFFASLLRSRDDVARR